MMGRLRPRKPSQEAEAAAVRAGVLCVEEGGALVGRKF